jgi:type I restriction enzyme S subunit
MSFEWKTVKLSEVSKIVSGGTPSTTENSYWDGNIPWITPKDLSRHKDMYVSSGSRSITEAGLKNSSAKLLPRDTVLFTSRAPIGYIAIASQPICTNQGFKSLVLNDGYDCRFFYYLLKHHTLDIEARATGSTFKEISGASLGSFEVSIPPVNVQKKIADFLSVLDDRITLLKEINGTLEDIAQALFKSWFVDFDPVRAKQEGKKPKGLDEVTASLFPDSFEQGELGRIPKGWKLTPFGDLLNLTIGGDWGDDFSNEQNNIRVAIIRGTDIPNLKSCVNNAVPVRYTSQKKLDTRKLKDGDIVIEVSGGTKNQPTGRSLYISNSLIKQFYCPVAPASFCRLMRPKTSELGILLAQHLTYIYEQGNTWEYQIQSTGIANFQTTYFLKKELVTVPSTEILNKFSEIIQPLIHSTQLSKIQHLTKLRDTLLPQLISGKIRLPDIEEINNKTKVNA